MATTNSQLNLAPMAVEPLRTATHRGAESLRTWREMVRRALGRAGISAKVAAGEMGITEQQLSDQLNGREKYHLSFWRMHALPPEFWREMVEAICHFHGIEPPGMSADDMEALKIGKAQIELHRQIAKAVSR
jgi:hypothetical protein